MLSGCSVVAKAALAPVIIGTLAAMGLMVGTASASVVYNDTFARGTTTTPQNLANTAPSPTDSNSATWSVYLQQTSTDTFVTNGTEAVDNPVLNNGTTYGTADSAFLPVTLLANTAYTYSATLTPLNPIGDDWVAMGFGNSALGGINNPDALAWLIYRSNGGVNAFFGGGTSGGLSGKNTGKPTSTPDTFTITMTTNSSLTGFVVNFSDSIGVLNQTGSFTVATGKTLNSYVNSIVIGTGGGTNANFQNLELTATAVPEPATLGLVAIGGMALLLLKRRRTV
jgi:hypothetical protein